VPQARIPAPVTAEVGTFEPGKIIEKVPCAQRPEQSYTLYLPCNYSASRSWPVVYSFDPGAPGSLRCNFKKTPRLPSTASGLRPSFGLFSRPSESRRPGV